MADTRKNDFTQGKIWQVILKMFLPLAVAQLVNVLYSVVDRMYIGHMEGVGSTALTGIGLCMPCIVIINAFAGLFGMGGAPLCSIARGAGETERAERLQGNSLSLLLTTGGFLMLLIYVIMKPLMYTFGASDETYPFAEAYMQIYLLGTIFVMISLGMNPYINSQGFAKIGMSTTIIGAVLNLILDPIFIFTFDMGIRGAALATVLSQICSAAWVLGFLFSKKAVLKLNGKAMRLKLSLVKEIIGMGMSSFFMSVTAGIVQAVANMQLKAFGSDVYVGIMTVVNSLQQVAFVAVVGLSQGSTPVLGYNYGAKRYDRVLQGIRFNTMCTLLYTGFISAVILLFPAFFVQIFNDEPELVKAAIPAIRTYFCCYVFMGFQMGGQTTYQSLGKAKKAVFFSLLRKVFIVVPLTILLPHIPGLGVMGVFLAETFSNVLGGLACFITMYFTEYKRLKRLIAEEEKQVIGG